MDLDGVGSPAGLAARIHELLPDLDLPVSLEELCKQLDISAITELETDGFEAALLTDEHKSSGAILHARGRHPARTRFSIAHELGHFLIPSHRPSTSNSMQCSLDHLLTSDAKAKDKRRRIEAEANRFAAHLLMPPAMVRKAILGSDTNLQAIATMADMFGVSKEAMARTWVEQHPDPVAIVIAQHGRIARYYRGEDFPWIACARGETLPDGSNALDLDVTPGRYSELEEIEPDTWLGERDAQRALALDEQVLGQSSGYRMILLVGELDED